MASLKDLRIRKASVVSTKKITAAMKMIAAAKMKKAQDQVEQSKVYADHMGQTLVSLVEKGRTFEIPPKLLVGTGKSERHLILLLTSDRGLCGGFNSNITRKTIKQLNEYKENGIKFQVISIGRRGRDILKASAHKDAVIESFPAFDKPKFWQASRIANMVLDLFEKDEFDVCTVIYNRFISVISQKITSHQIIPYNELDLKGEDMPHNDNKLSAVYEYDPSEQTVLSQLLPKNIAVQIYRALLENAASEHGARMTAMDAATRNASEMIDKLSLVYNRTRQAMVTKELIEIISGANAAAK
ncbi:MAG: F0F1 ATP synthase subunit gamma [Alphaproteobacteria bacterium]|nr:F0F1 ATP synthase subunit gamma [Alphaproteobacteria bacterium]